MYTASMHFMRSQNQDRWITVASGSVSSQAYLSKLGYDAHDRKIVLTLGSAPRCERTVQQLVPHKWCRLVTLAP